jgi:hypothetical protein
MQGTLVTQLKHTLPTILEDQPVDLAYLYGSTVTGYVTPFSDMDVALVVYEPLTPLARLKLIQYVQMALYEALCERCDIPDADVRIINDAPLILRGKVVTEGVLLYARDEAQRIAFETHTRMRYFDYLPIHRMMQRQFFDTLRKRGLHG